MRRLLNDETRQAAPGAHAPLRDGSVHYRVTGPPNAPTMILVHGFAAPSFSWKFTTADLVSAGFRVIAFDLYGRGWSDRPVIRYDVNLFDRQLKGLLDYLGITEPVGLIGWSMGGLICSVFAARHPHRVASLSIIGPAGLPTSVNIKGLITLPGVGEAVVGSVGVTMLRKGLDRTFHDHTHLAWFRENFDVQTRFKGYRRALLSTLRHMPLDDSEHVYAQLGRSGLPLQMIWGHHDQICPYENHRRLQQLVPHAELCSVSDAGHAAHIERRQLVSPAFVGFHSHLLS